MSKGGKHKNIWEAVLKEKWDYILTIIGLFLALSETENRWLTIMFGVFIVIVIGRLFWHIHRIYRINRDKDIPLIMITPADMNIVRGITQEIFSLVEKYNFDSKEFDSLFDIEKEDYILRHDTYIPPTEFVWASLAQGFERRIQSFNAVLAGRKKYHVFLKCPAALAIGMGAAAGTKYDLVVYHYEKGQYYPVIDFDRLRAQRGISSHILKSPVEEPFKYIVCEEPLPEPSGSNSKKLFIALNLAGHFIVSEARAYAEEQGGSILVMNNTYNNTLPLAEDWVLAAREVSTVIHRYASQNIFESVELLLGCPLPIAFAVGMSVGTQSRINIHNWYRDEGVFKPVLKLHHLGINY